MIPSDLKYTKTHEWVRISGDTAEIGITHFAQEQLGDITFVELPAPGTQVTAGKEMGSIESVKAASDIYAPVSGQVSQANTALEASPELVNQDPYGEGWMVRVASPQIPADLLSAAAYEQLVSEAH